MADAKEDKAAGKGRFERWMFLGVPLWLVLLGWLLGLLALFGFGALVKSGVEGSTRYGFLSRWALAIASAPSMLRETATAANPLRPLEEREALPDGWRAGSGGFIDPGYALIARYRPERGRSVVDLLRLSDGRVVREYAPDVRAMHAGSKIDSPLLDLINDKTPSRYRMKHPFLTDDGGLIFQNSSPLIRIDACGRRKWMIDGIFHHSIEADANGDLWVPITRPRAAIAQTSEKYNEDGIAKVSQDGRVLYREWLPTILRRNGLAYLYEGIPYSDEPFHLNDIQPVPADGPYWRKGDVFLSVRNLSLIALYRPGTGKILWWKQGPWLSQHDVSILDDHRIGVFDNNAIAAYPRNYVRGTNHEMIYDFATGAVSAPFDKALRLHDVRTIWEGRGTPLPNGDLFVEESNYGRLMRITPDGGVRWRYISADSRGRRYILGWSRYLDPAANGAAIRAAASAQCS